jgi:hypothetical protein
VLAHRGRARAATIALALLLGVATASLLPLIETNTWWIRYLDFPRLQVAVATSVLLALCLDLRCVPPLDPETLDCDYAARGSLSIWSRRNWAGERWPCRSISQFSL